MNWKAYVVYQTIILNCHIENRALLKVTHIHCKSADIFEMVPDKVVTIDH